MEMGWVQFFDHSGFLLEFNVSVDESPNLILCKQYTRIQILGQLITPVILLINRLQVLNLRQLQEEGNIKLVQLLQLLKLVISDFLLGLL